MGIWRDWKAVERDYITCKLTKLVEHRNGVVSSLLPRRPTPEHKVLMAQLHLLAFDALSAARVLDPYVALDPDGKVRLPDQDEARDSIATLSASRGGRVVSQIANLAHRLNRDEQSFDLAEEASRLLSNAPHKERVEDEEWFLAYHENLVRWARAAVILGKHAKARELLDDVVSALMKRIDEKKDSPPRLRLILAIALSNHGLLDWREGRADEGRRRQYRAAYTLRIENDIDDVVREAYITYTASRLENTRRAVGGYPWARYLARQVVRLLQPLGDHPLIARAKVLEAKAWIKDTGAIGRMEKAQGILDAVGAELENVQGAGERAVLGAELAHAQVWFFEHRKEWGEVERKAIELTKMSRSLYRAEGYLHKGLAGVRIAREPTDEVEHDLKEACTLAEANSLHKTRLASHLALTEYYLKRRKPQQASDEFSVARDLRVSVQSTHLREWYSKIEAAIDGPVLVSLTLDREESLTRFRKLWGAWAYERGQRDKTTLRWKQGMG